MSDRPETEVKRPAAMRQATALVREEWLRRVEAEYRSASLTHHFTHWLIQIGAPPDLITDGLRIVGDELAHAELSHAVYQDALGVDPPRIDRTTLTLQRTADAVLEWEVLRYGVEIFCLGETVAVPLFSYMREHVEVPSARAALDRILVDEVFHRDFGWNVLDWLLETPLAEHIAITVEGQLPEMFSGLVRNYGSSGELVITDDDRAWGLASGADYRRILERTYERDWAPRFAERGINAGPAWAERHALSPG